MGWPGVGGSDGGDTSPIEKLTANQILIEKLTSNTPLDFLRKNLGWPDTGDQVKSAIYFKLGTKLSKPCVILPFTVSYKENLVNSDQLIRTPREGFLYIVHVMPLLDQIEKLKKAEEKTPQFEVADFLLEIEYNPLNPNHPFNMFYADGRKANPGHGGYRRDPHSIIHLNLEKSVDVRRLDLRPKATISNLKELDPSSLIAQAEKRKSRLQNERLRQSSHQRDEPELQKKRVYSSRSN